MKDVVTSDTSAALTIPTKTWTLDMFGGGQMVVLMTDATPSPSWYQRFMSSLLLGSVWTKLD